MSANSQGAAHVNRLLDAIELVQDDRREEAVPILRELIREDKDFEDAWLWMSVAVDSADQSMVCLDNVLRINPGNMQAAGALYRLRAVEMASEKKRARLRLYRDFSLAAMWCLAIFILFAILLTYAARL